MDTMPDRPQKPAARRPRRTAAFLLLAAVLFPAPVLADGGDLYGSWLAEDIGGGGVIDRLQTVLELSDGDLAILDGDKRTHDAYAHGETTLLCVSKADFKRILAEHV